MESYPTPSSEVRIEMQVVNSRFIATLAPASSVEEARTFIDRVRTEFADATHNVPVYIIGQGASVIAHSSDDGEPSGTAGRPALAVLQGSGVGDVAVVVTRYFGGTKLGTGGLVRAYSDAVRQVLGVAPLARRVPTHTLLVVSPYPLFERVRLLISNAGGEILDEDFTADVTITTRFPREEVPAFQSRLMELSAGKLQGEIVESGYALFPIGKNGGAL